MVKPLSPFISRAAGITADLFSRGWVLYAVLAAVILRTVDFSVTGAGRMNFLRNNVEAYLGMMQYGEGEADPVVLAMGVHYYEKLLPWVDPPSPVYANLGFCHFYLKDTETAVSFYRRAIETEKGYYPYYWDLGMIFYHLRHYEQAANFWQQSLTLIPQAVSYYQLARPLKNNKNGPVLNGLLNLLIQQAKEDQAKGYHMLAMCAMQTDRPAKMLEFARAGRKLFPENLLLLFDEGLAQFLSGDWPAAEDLFSKLIQRDPSDSQAYYYRALSRDKMGQAKQAEQDRSMLAALKAQGVGPSKRYTLPSLHIHTALMIVRYGMGLEGS